MEHSIQSILLGAPRFYHPLPLLFCEAGSVIDTTVHLLKHGHYDSEPATCFYSRGTRGCCGPFPSPNGKFHRISEAVKDSKFFRFFVQTDFKLMKPELTQLPVPVSRSAAELAWQER
jgi:hypothetical protein